MARAARLGSRFRLTIGYVILAVAVVISFGLSLGNQDRIEEEAREDARTLCESNNDLKAVILTLIERLSEGGGRTDFTAIPGFDDLEPSVQTYLQQLSEATGQAAGEGRSLTIAREVLVPLDCDRDAE